MRSEKFVSASKCDLKLEERIFSECTVVAEWVRVNLQVPMELPCLPCCKLRQGSCRVVAVFHRVVHRLDHIRVGLINGLFSKDGTPVLRQIHIFDKNKPNWYYTKNPKFKFTANN